MQHIIKEVIKLTRAGLPSNIMIAHDIDEDCKPIMADPTQIHQVAMNLITNAFHAMEQEGGALTIALEMIDGAAADYRALALDPREYVCLKVSDTGTGIDRAIQDRIFEPYFTTKAEGKGTGLGLAMIHGIVKLYHGDIQVLSQLGRWTTFAVYLPCIGAHPKEMAEIGKITLSGGVEHLLFVDDEPLIVDLISSTLTRLGYRVTTCADGAVALETFKAAPQRFDLVITDLTMPHLTGDRLIRAIKGIRPEIPVILATGFKEKIDAQRAADICIDRILHKPVKRAQLAVAIREVLDASRGVGTIKP